MNFITEKAQLEKENEEVGDMDLVHQFFSYWFSRYQIKKILLFFTEAKNYEFYHRESTARERKRGGWRHGL